MNTIENNMKQKNELKEAVLLTSRRIVRSEGWQSLSIRKIAEVLRSDIPEIAGLHSIDAIYFEFLREGFLLLNREIKGVMEKNPAPDAQIKAMADACWNFAFTNSEHYHCMFCCETAEKQMPVPEKDELHRMFMEPINSILVKNNKPDGAIANLKYQSTWDVLHGVVFSIKNSSNADGSGQFNKRIFDDVVAGCIRNLNV